MTLLDHALGYAKRGWAVFPVFGIENGQCTCGRLDCGSAGKHPMTNNGYKAATTDARQIISWWTENPNANIGIATGKISNLIVVDVDVGREKVGLESLEELEREYGQLPKDFVVRTGGGGLHIFLAADDRDVCNSAGRVGLDIDMRGDGGHVVVPPSLHLSGKTYSWESFNE